jgi:hypothetical protein
MVAAAGAAGLAAGGLVPLYLPAWRPRRGGRAWPGVVAYGRRGPGRRGSGRDRIPGMSVRLNMTDEVAGPVEAVRAEARGMDFEDAGEMGFWLGMIGEDADADGVGTVVVYLGDYRVGALRDDGFYREILAEPRHTDTLLMTEAVCSRAPDSSWRLHIRSPRPHLSLVRFPGYLT